MPGGSPLSATSSLAARANSSRAAPRSTASQPPPRSLTGHWASRRRATCRAIAPARVLLQVPRPVRPRRATGGYRPAAPASPVQRSSWKLAPARTRASRAHRSQACVWLRRVTSGLPIAPTHRSAELLRPSRRIRQARARLTGARRMNWLVRKAGRAPFCVRLREWALPNLS